MVDRALRVLVPLILVACSAPAQGPAVAPEASAAPAGSEPAADAPDAGALDSGPAVSGELIGEKIQEPGPAAGDPKAKEQEATLAAAVLMKSGHKECLAATRDKTKSDWKPVHYEIVVTLKADGGVVKVEADKTKTKVSEPSFLPCVIGKLEKGKYPAPGRDVTARLVFPDG